MKAEDQAAASGSAIEAASRTEPGWAAAPPAPPEPQTVPRRRDGKRRRGDERQEAERDEASRTGCSPSPSAPVPERQQTLTGAHR